MANVFLAIGEGIEADAKDVADFFDRLGKTAELIVSPKALIALSILAVPLGKAVADGIAAAAQDGLNIPLDAATAQLMIACWPDVLAYFKTLDIQPTKGKTP